MTCPRSHSSFLFDYKACVLREISSGLCDHLEGWDREGGREGGARGKRYGNICICITDSLCYKAETNTPL